MNISPNVYLWDMDCLTSTDCMAVGQSSGEAVAQRWNGTAWTALVLPGIVKFSALYSVSCPAADACLAIGTSENLGTSALAEEWNGQSWRELAAVPDAAGASGLSCVSMTDCMAADGGNENGGLALAWDGQTWMPTEIPYPFGPAGGLDSVSCLSATFCLGMGGGWLNNDDAVAFSAVWNGTAWTHVSSVTELNDEGYFSGVSCTSTTSCIAAGNMTARWNGHRLTVADILAPPSEDQPLLSGLSCASATDCTAAGEIIGGDGYPSQGFADQWNGSSWQLQTVPSPGAGYDLTAVSCPTTSDCLAAGGELLGQTHVVGLTETETGGSWQATPIPAGYDIQSGNGGMSNFGTSWYGSQKGSHQAVGVATDPATGGYWILETDGGVANYQAPWYGSQNGRLPTGAKPVAIADDPATGGYWVLDSNGGVSNYGAPWYGSQKGHLPAGTRPVAITADPATGGYWILDANGGVSNYHAPWYGSERGHVTGSAVGLAADPATGGYWILDSQGGVSNYHAPWYGSERGHLTAPIVALTTAPATDGYWILNAKGGVSNYHAPWYGSLAGPKLTSPVVGLSGQ